MRKWQGEIVAQSSLLVALSPLELTTSLRARSAKHNNRPFCLANALEMKSKPCKTSLNGIDKVALTDSKISVLVESEACQTV